MLWYIVKLVLILPVIGALIWGSLKFLQKMQTRYSGGAGQAKSVRVVETTRLSPTLKLAVLEVQGREILVSVSRGGLTRLAEGPARETAA